MYISPSPKQLKDLGVTYSATKRSSFDQFLALSDTARAKFLARTVKCEISKKNNENICLVETMGKAGKYQAMAYSGGQQKTICATSAKFKGLTMNQPHQHRVHCTEFQLLNLFYIKQRMILSSQTEPFTVKIWTEKSPCVSCTEVIAQFLAFYPKAEAVVFHNWKDNYSGPRISWQPFGARIRTLQTKF